MKYVIILMCKKKYIQGGFSMKKKFIGPIVTMAAGFTAVVTGVISFIIALKPIVCFIQTIDPNNEDNE